MPALSHLDAPCPDAAGVNEAIRRLVRAQGGRPWGERERAELARLRAAWLAAVRGAA